VPETAATAAHGALMPMQSDGDITRNLDRKELFECLDTLVDACKVHGIAEIHAEFGEVWGELFRPGERLLLKPHHIRLQIEMAEAQDTGTLGEDLLSVVIPTEHECRVEFDRSGRVQLAGAGEFCQSLLASWREKAWI